MAWNPWQKLKQKLSGAPAPEAAAAQIPSGKESVPAAAGLPDMKELEQKGLLGKFFRHWKNPAFLRQIKAISVRMQADGVNIKDQKAVMAWVQAHQKEIESGQFKEAAAARKPQTYVKTSPDVGRNDPCACGSGKKHKKCCGAGA